MFNFGFRARAVSASGKGRSELLLFSACLCLACSSAESADLSPGKSTTESEGTTEAGGAADLGWDDTPISSSADSGGQGQGGEVGDESADCLRLMSWGRPAAGGVAPGQAGLDAMVYFLNEQSNAVAEHAQEQIAITDEVLSNYDVILLQNISDWALSDAEVATFSRWIKAGGAVFALSGFDGGDDVRTSNRLLSFSGLNFSVTDPDTALALGDCGYCLGSSRKITGFDPNHPISHGVSVVGAFVGHSIQGDGQVVIAEDGLALAVTKEVELGRVFLFHDDWITYVAQWTGEMQLSCATNPTCSEESPQTSYQVAQFWFNALTWLVPKAAECLSFEGDVVVR